MKHVGMTDWQNCYQNSDIVFQENIFIMVQEKNVI